MQCDITLAVCAHYAALVIFPDIASSRNVFSFPFCRGQLPPPDPVTTADLAAPFPRGPFSFAAQLFSQQAGYISNRNLIVANTVLFLRPKPTLPHFLCAAR
ncbi:hypothetical protein TMES_03365 [Thalassospira mesophila]|uniref:Uncharacterized protein n=1 Tax=Thalassospira mesophila TaxID=1293891 RepID=A0A1Y2L4H6_9PROT|nr:hypothetical protein TMES_03365 [Thalassospira mesophila]